ncbi:MAG: SHD1 domain-containing protein [Akkermansiaceae bacterium]
MKIRFHAVLGFLMIQMCASARTWTDVKGRTIEGELVRVEAEIAVIKVNGREFRIPFQKLSEKDQEFLRTHEDQSLATVSEAGSLFGTELKAGETVEVTGPLNDKSAQSALWK